MVMSTDFPDLSYDQMIKNLVASGMKRTNQTVSSLVANSIVVITAVTSGATGLFASLQAPPGNSVITYEGIQDGQGALPYSFGITAVDTGGNETANLTPVNIALLDPRTNQSFGTVGTIYRKVNMIANPAAGTSYPVKFKNQNSEYHFPLGAMLEGNQLQNWTLVGPDRNIVVAGSSYIGVIDMWV
jgi:hypothetical protein